MFAAVPRLANLTLRRRGANQSVWSYRIWAWLGWDRAFPVSCTSKPVRAPAMTTQRKTEDFMTPALSTDKLASFQGRVSHRAQPSGKYSTGLLTFPLLVFNAPNTTRYGAGKGKKRAEKKEKKNRTSRQ